LAQISFGEPAVVVVDRIIRVQAHGQVQIPDRILGFRVFM